MATYSLKSLDVGFNVRVLAMPVRLQPDTTHVVYDGGEARGTLEEVALALCRKRFTVYVELPSGRQVRVRKGKFEAQPPNDNYWRAFKTLAEARQFAARGR